MAQSKPSATKPKRAGFTGKSEHRGLNNVNRSAYFARREASKVLRSALQDLRIIKEVLESGNILNSKWKKQEELMYIMTYDILFGKETSLAGGDAEKFLMRRKDALQTALAKLLVSKKVKHVDDLVSLYQPPDILKPCYVRVNTLKGDVDSSIHQLSKQFRVERDAVVPNLLILPPNTDLHNHPLVLDGSVFVQIRAILLDPSCSGSGTAAQRLDHLLPSHSIHDVDTERLNKLAAFQRRALTHALSFPGVEKVIYSTCSVNQTENEDVVSAVLPLASSLGFELSTPFPLWNCRGLPVIEGSEHLLRTDPAQHKEGFFIALFVKKCSSTKTSEVDSDGEIPNTVSDVKSGGIKRKRSAPLLWNKMWRISSFAWQTRRKLRHEL
ncbi:25S rRNA (cytosine-C(5))-methyltransferase NSUN5 [Linum perenne]